MFTLTHHVKQSCEFIYLSLTCTHFQLSWTTFLRLASIKGIIYARNQLKDTTVEAARLYLTKHDYTLLHIHFDSCIIAVPLINNLTMIIRRVIL